MRDGLLALAQGMRTLGPRLMPQLAAACADGLAAAAAWGFVVRKDIYGRPYPVPKDGHLPPMERTKALRNSCTSGPRRQGGAWEGVLRNYQDHAEYLRSGTAHMDAREHMPSPGQTLPPRWERFIDFRVQPALERGVQAVMR